MSEFPRRVLAISGSLRAGSSNTELLRAASEIGPPRFAVRLYDGIDQLPFFNPDLDGDAVSPDVAEFRAAVGAAEIVVISSPEYAHGVPGVLKNALDWLVGSAQCEIVGKAVVLANLSSRSTFADASLSETLRVMGANVSPSILLEPAPATDPWRAARELLAVIDLQFSKRPGPAPTPPSRRTAI